MDHFGDGRKNRGRATGFTAGTLFYAVGFFVAGAGSGPVMAFAALAWALAADFFIAGF